MKSEEEKEKRVAEMLYGLAEVFGKETLSPVAIEFYWKVLEKYSEEQISQAATRAVEELKFFPKPAELKEFITGTPTDRELRGHEQAILVLDEIKGSGASTSVQFDDPVTTAVIKRVYAGWQEICKLTIDETKWFLREFAQHYSNFTRSGIEDHGHCPGIIEHQNQMMGYSVKNEDEEQKLLQ